MGSLSLKKMQPFVRVLATSLEITMSYLVIVRVRVRDILIYR